MTTTTLEPVAGIPARIHDQLNDLERIRRNHPDILSHASSLRFGDSRLIVCWGRFNADQEQMRAFALANPDVIWKPRASYKGSSDLDWIGVLHGVTVELECAQSLPLERLPDRVDLSAIKPPQPSKETTP